MSRQRRLKNPWSHSIVATRRGYFFPTYRGLGPTATINRRSATKRAPQYGRDETANISATEKCQSKSNSALGHTEAICKALECQPGDILEYK
jgi:hypothetical protein